MPSVEGLGQVVPFERKPDEASDGGAADPLTLASGSHVALARAVLAALKGDETDAPECLYCEGAFYQFEDGVWAVLDDDAVRRRIYDFDGTKPVSGRTIVLTKSTIDGVIREMQTLAAAPGFFDDPTPGIACQNGFVVIPEDGEPYREPLTPEHRVRWRFPAALRPQGFVRPPTNTMLNRLMNGCFGEEAGAMCDLLMEVAGVAAAGLATRLRQPKAVILHGQSAANGKSQVLNVLRGLLPADAVSTVTPAQMSTPRYAVQLAGALLNTSDELGGAAIAGEAFKQAVTGDPMTAHDVYKPAVTFRPNAQHVFATNALPPFLAGMDRGVRRRLSVVPFNRTVPKDEQIPGIGRLILDDEGDLLLELAVAGAARAFRQGGFTEPALCREALSEWIVQADVVQQWLAETDTMDLEPGGYLSAKEAYHAFRDWAEGAGFTRFTIPQPNQFARRVNAAGLAWVSHRRRNGRGGWLGLPRQHE